MDESKLTKHDEDISYAYKHVGDKTFVLQMDHVGSSIAFAQDDDGKSSNPAPCLGFIGVLRDRTGAEITPDFDDENSIVSIIMNDPAQALDIITSALTIVMDKERIQLAMKAIMSLIMISETPVYVQASAEIAAKLIASGEMEA